MEPQFNTSFIPKKSLQADVSGGGSSGKIVGRRDVYGPGFYLALLIFIASVLAAAGIFGYTTIIQNTVDKKITTLENQKKLFSEENIAMLVRAESHINNARKILNSHVAVTEFFKELERITLRRVQYMELIFTAVPGTDSRFSVTGFSENFQNVALQTTEYRNSPSLSFPIVRNLERTEIGPVLFTLDVSVDPMLISYKRSLQDMQVNTIPPAQPAGVDTLVDPLLNSTENPAGTEGNVEN